MRYLAQEYPFCPVHFTSAVDSCTWWKSGLREGYPKELAELAIHLSTCIATSAGLERFLLRLISLFQAIFYSKNHLWSIKK